LTYNHSPLIIKIDTVRAFYFGTAYLVEVDIVLPENMVLKEAHDIGESLQKRIEDLPDVERVCLNIHLLLLIRFCFLSGICSYRL
jgi:divalent metal cation (Fe/Co/Zn/Cd) transporter